MDEPIGTFHERQRSQALADVTEAEQMARYDAWREIARVVGNAAIEYEAAVRLERVLRYRGDL